MKFRLIHQERQWHGVNTLCRALSVSRGGYWKWLKHRPSSRQLGDSLLLSDIRRVPGDGRKAYGSPRVHEALGKEGVRCGRKRVERLMKENGIKAKQGKKFKPVMTDSWHQLPVAPNVLNRQFVRERPNEVWVADTTYISTKEGWLYLAVVLDLFSRRVVGWAMGDSNDRCLPLRALHMAVQRRCPPRGLIHHSDRGSTWRIQPVVATSRKERLRWEHQHEEDGNERDVPCCGHLVARWQDGVSTGSGSGMELL